MLKDLLLLIHVASNVDSSHDGNLTSALPFSDNIMSLSEVLSVKWIIHFRERSP